MNQKGTEVVVGIFVLAGLICLGYLAVRLGKLDVLGSHGYLLYADFANVSGLRQGDAVEIAGVNVGRVDSLQLYEDRARLGLSLDPNVEVQEDSIASIRARGLLGDKYVSISPGASSNVIPAGGRIRETESPPDITDLIGKLIGGDVTGKPPQ